MIKITKDKKLLIWISHVFAILLNILFLISLFSYVPHDEIIIVNSLPEQIHNNLGYVGHFIINKMFFILGLAIYPLAIFSFFSSIYYLWFEMKDYYLYVTTLIVITICLTVLLTINPELGESIAPNLNLSKMTGGVIGSKLANLDTGILNYLIDIRGVQLLKLIVILVLMLSIYCLYRLMLNSSYRSLELKKDYFNDAINSDESNQKVLFKEFEGIQEVKNVDVENQQNHAGAQQEDLYEKTIDKPNEKEIPKMKVDNISEIDDKPKKITQNTKYKLPKVSLLNQIENNKMDHRQETKERYEALEEALQDFNVKVKIEGVTRGPRVTLFEVVPEKGTPINSISKHSENFAISMRARNVRISSLPERGTVGIEVPNKSSEAVDFSQLLKSVEWEKSAANIPICLGKNISNDTVIMDLAKCPHLLIAGATGAGKSVFMNTLILSLVYKFTPQDLNLVMVDPKFVEFAAYEKLPHLICPVITDANKSPIALRWATYEMDCRYRLLATTKSKNINSFNSRIITKDSLQEDSEGNLIPKKLPYLVVIIDELADLMMMAKKDIETSIARVAQKGRAAGVHLVIATQRPSVDVITGLIKANFPTRIAFQVSSAIDSRTILESTGAEKLLGQGDMLFTPPGASGMQRIQGAYVPDDDIFTVVSNCSKQQNANYIDIFSKVKMNESEGEEKNHHQDVKDDRKNALLQQAVEVILKDKKISTSHIQRRLSIGYNSAADIVENLESLGYISEPLDGKGSRQIYIEENPFIKH